jgi:hypothetical protein
MKTRIIQTVIIIFMLFSFGCQKADLRKDGYFIFKANDKKNSFNKCVWGVENYTEDTIPVHMNTIFAFKRKDMIDSAIKDRVDIYFDGDTAGKYSKTLMTGGTNSFFIEILYKDIGYSMYSLDQNLNPTTNVQMNISTYDVNKGIIEGSVSGTFFHNDGSSIVITHCDFLARSK